MSQCDLTMLDLAFYNVSLCPTALSIEDSDTKTTFNIEACFVWKTSLFKIFKVRTRKGNLDGFEWLMHINFVISYFQSVYVLDSLSSLFRQINEIRSVLDTCIQLSLNTYI